MNNTILDLIQGADVEWKTLSSVDNIVTLNRGRVISKTYLQENVGDYPVYSSQTENNGEIGKIATFDYDKECLTWTTDGANAGTVFHRSGKFSVTNVCGIITINDESYLSYRFLYYWLSIVMKSYVYAGMGNPKLMSNQVERIKIPIPSLEIQQKVVEILDKMTDYVTELTAELTAELTLRQKQYAYYRDQLLSFGAEANLLNDSEESFGVRWTTLGEICEIKRGKRLVRNELEEVGKYPVYQNSMTPLGYYHQFNFDGDNTFIICAGAAGEIGYMSENFWAADDVSVLTVPSNLMSRYLYHFLLTKQNSIKSKVRRASVPRLSKISFENIKIPVPSMSEQKHIVEILDKFDKLTSDLTEGLPREIRLRQKQYEYWREQLLSFKKE